VRVGTANAPKTTPWVFLSPNISSHLQLLVNLLDGGIQGHFGGEGLMARRVFYDDLATALPTTRLILNFMCHIVSCILNLIPNTTRETLKRTCHATKLLLLFISVRHSKASLNSDLFPHGIPNPSW